MTHMKNYHWVGKVLKITLTAWVLVCSMLIAISYLLLQQIKTEQTDEFIEMQSEVTHLYNEDGLNALLDEYELSHRPIWHKHESDERLDEEGLLFSLYDKNTLLLGSTELTITPVDEAVWQKYDSTLDEPISALYIHFTLDERYSLAILQPLTHHYIDTRNTLISINIWFTALSWLPILFIIFSITQQYAVRIVRIKNALSKVAESPDSERIDCDKTPDELNALVISLNAMLDDISDLHTTMKTMSVGIAHDLKTPLTRVANRLQCMQQDITSPDMLETHLDKASSDLHTVIATFNNLVRLNAIESGKHKNGFVELNLSSTILDLAQSYEPVFIDTGRNLEISIVDDVFCLADEDLINQLVCNLLENALEYSSQDAQVWIRLQNHIDGALLQVGDNGPGISVQDRSYVFDKFYRADISRSKPGNGLGLSIVKAICKVHRGEIQLLEHQKGAVFNIELPLLSQ
ncbi:HAMP domain-containing sensor histidine kinase [Pseudoalteromonas sp. MMG005]|uniref:sensor histidine kinase n=1 Tax=Pseudoalteromonas sp. MMG005 TaxID=2822682 RepID=UPI001B3A7451|nr:HAMP domain-containing sensor histidine kinase [Pseudoalteromonas sp. MMG005]